MTEEERKRLSKTETLIQDYKDANKDKERERERESHI